MKVLEIDPHHEALLHRHWEIGRAAEDASRLYDFYAPWESARQNYTEGREDLDTVLLGAFDGAHMWGAARIDHSVHDNLHSATATYYVDPVRQRQGIGRTLAEASYEVSRLRGRRLMVTEAYAPVGETSAGLLFGEAMGFTAAIEDGMKIVDLWDTEPTWAGLATAVAPRHEEYTIATWLDRLPDEFMADYCRLSEIFFDEAPMGELDVENERWDQERVRAREARNTRQGRHNVAAGAVSPAGDMVGLTEASVSDAAPHRGFQSGTLIAPAHRGHGLGLAIKLANHRQLREHFPACRVLLTGNADVNAPMNAVNDALGYHEVERCVEMQRVI